jgi:protein tyrosine phosphatase (PTP) superfamily phosphohydrolase (DUF442 family)
METSFVPPALLQFIPRNWGQVEPGLYRSGRLAATLSEKTLREHRIEVMVSLLNDNPARPDAVELARAATALGIERHIFSMDGNGTSTPQRYAAAVAAIDSARKRDKRVLVHCKAGAQRTGGVIATYELLVRGATPAMAFEQMTAFGHDPDDNPKLLPWLNENLPAIAAELVRLGVIDRVPDPIPRLEPR